MISVLQAILFTATLIAASVIDVKKRIVPTYIHLILLAIGALSLGWDSVFGFFCGFLCTFVPALIKADVGGGDIKICACIGFVLKALVLPALLLGLFLAIIVVPIQKRICHDSDSSFALVPWISIGSIAMSIVLI